MASTSRSLRRRKLLHHHSVVDPEMVSLYHDEPMLDASPPSPSRDVNNSRPSSTINLTLGTPSQMTPRTRRHLDTINKNNVFPNIYTPSSSLVERLNRINDQDHANKQSKDKIGCSIFDLKAYEMVPDKIKLALSTSGQECRFTRNDFFLENTSPTQPQPPQSLSHPSNVIHSPSPIPVATVTDENQASVTPGSPASSVISVATSISDTTDVNLLSWPGSPIASSPTSNRFKPSSTLSFGRVDPFALQRKLNSPSTPQNTGNNNNISKMGSPSSSTVTHPLATELDINPFLDTISTSSSPSLPSSPNADTLSSMSAQKEPSSNGDNIGSPSLASNPQLTPLTGLLSPCSAITETIPLSTRMQRRFPHHVTLQRQRRERPHSRWSITDRPPQQQRANSAIITKYKASSRRRLAGLQQLLPARQRYRSRQLTAVNKSTWLESDFPTLQ